MPSNPLKLLTEQGRVSRRSKKDREKEERERRLKEKTEATFKGKLPPTSPATTPLYEPWYGASGDSTSQKDENVGATSIPHEEVLQMAATFSSTQSHQLNKHEPNATGAISSESSIMSRGRNGKLTGNSAVTNHSLKGKISKGDLPPEPTISDPETDQTLRKKYVKSEETQESTTGAIVKRERVKRRAIGAEPTRTRRHSRGSSASPSKTTSIDSGRQLITSYPSVPKHIDLPRDLFEDTGIHVKTVSRTNSDNFYDDADEVPELSDGIHGHGVTKSGRALRADYMQRKVPDTMNDSESLSDDNNASTNEVESLKEKLKKRDQQVKDLRREKERESGRLEGIEATYKNLYEKQLSQEQTAHAAVVRKFEEKIDEMRSNHDAEEKEMQANLLSQKEKYEKGLLDKKKSYEARATTAADEYKEELASISIKLGLAVESKARDLGELKGKHAGELREARKETEAWKLAWEKIHFEKENEIEVIRRDNEDALALEKENSLKLKETHAIEIDNMQHQHQIDIKTAVYELRERIQDLETELQQANDTRDEVIETYRKTYEAQIAKMKQDHEVLRANQFRQLQEDNEALKTLLFKRDNFKAMTDTDLGERFTLICHEVDEIARVEWNRACGLNWPIPEHLLPQSKIPRIAKQHLMENTLWVILYEKIFCTPFRVFGREGRLLEADWSRNAKQDHNSNSTLSPRASKESEQWRYERMVKLLESIKKPLASSDPIKQGYEATLQEVAGELLRELEKVAPISDIEDQDIDQHRINDLVRNAAELWLDIGQQRFRTRLVMSATGEKAVKSRQNALSPGGTLNLVVSPGLRRLGNAQGEQLNHEEPVMSCEGTFEVFRTR